MTRVLQFPVAGQAPAPSTRRFDALSDADLAFGVYIELGRTLEAEGQSPHLVRAHEAMKALCGRLLGANPDVPSMELLGAIPRIAESMEGGEA